MDEPPPYTDSHSPQQPAETNNSPTSVSRPSIPTDAQKAQLPLKLQRAHESITGPFHILDTASPKSPPDVFLKTTHAKISTTLWVEGGLPRPFTIEAFTNHASIELAVNMLLPTQAVHITVTNSHGEIRVALPEAFHGLLTLSTPHGKHTLSPELKARSVLVAHEGPMEENKIAYQIGGPDGESMAVLATVHNYISVGLATDAAVLKDENSGGCVIL